MGLGEDVSVGVDVSGIFVLIMTIGVNVGSSMEVAMMGGSGVGVGCSGGVFSASESEIPPMTSRSERTAIMSPPPISRRARIFISPPSGKVRSWQWAGAR